MIIFAVCLVLALGWYSLYITCVTEQSDSQAVGLTVSAALTINQFFIVLAPTVYGLLVAVFPVISSLWISSLSWYYSGLFTYIEQPKVV